jgi:hypothetical protein
VKPGGPGPKGGRRNLSKEDGGVKVDKGDEGNVKTGGPDPRTVAVRSRRKTEAPKVTKVWVVKVMPRLAMTKGGNRARKKGEDGSAKGDRGMAPKSDVKSGGPGPGPKGGRALEKEDGGAKGDKGMAPERDVKTGRPVTKGGSRALKKENGARRKTEAPKVIKAWLLKVM